jgi:site-specific DNA-methyltransferase (adenine-specific)
MKINIHLGDSLKAMKGMEDNQYDLAIVDPPYGIGFDNKIRDNKTKSWDKEIPKDFYFDELIRVSKNIIVWGGNYFPYLWVNGCKGFVFWNKDINFNTYSAGELAFTSFNLPAKYFYYAWNGLADGIRGRNKVNKTIHPTQKPVALYKWLLKNYGFNKDGSKRTIIDTHGGSMSIVIACIDMGFDIDIWELDEDYYRDATNRIKRYLAQMDLTREPVEINFLP